MKSTAIASFSAIFLVSTPLFSTLAPLCASASQISLSFPPETECRDNNRVAIIGAGAAGTSAAFWIGKAVERHGLSIDVDVFDRNSYIGGRSTTVQPYDDPTLEPIELGGSVFVHVNKILWRAVDDFGFKRMQFENDEDVMGIWDGEKFVITMGGNNFYSGWWTKLKVLWRYGFRSPQRTQAIVDKLVKSILRLYQNSPPIFTNISSFASSLGWADAAAQTALQFLHTHGVDDRWSQEFVEATTRLNYGQDVDRIHGIEGLVSLAADGASTVVGGNRQIFERFAEDSNASFFLNTTVKSVTRASSSGPWLVNTSATDEPRPYRAVILTAPFYQTGIGFSADTPIASVPEQPYVQIYVTILTTTSPSANVSYFNLAPGSEIPAMILTTYNGARQGGPEPEFNSLSYLRPVRNRDLTAWKNAKGETEWIVKIFSKQRISDSWLQSMFDGKVGWVLRKEWDAYPILSPSTEFPPVMLADRLYYVNAFEPLISTMETEILSARNAVEMLLQEHFGIGICKERSGEASEAMAEDSDYVYGWDC